MATAESVKAKLQNLITLANNTTGNTDATLTQAVNALIAGFGQGGGGDVTGLAYDMGEFSYDEDKVIGYVTDPIPHNLGAVPDFVCVWTDEWAGATEAPYETLNTFVGFLWLNQIAGMTGRASSAANLTNPYCILFSIAAGDYRMQTLSPTSAAYGLSGDFAKMPTIDDFELPYWGTQGARARAGVNYKYFVSKAWWTVGGGASA